MSEVNPAVAALIARYRSAPTATPNVNPPEAAKVIEAQTAPEIAAVPASEPTPEPVTAPEPAPAAAEPPKAKRGPGRPPKPAAVPATPVAASDWVERATTESIVAELQDRGYRVTLESSR